MNVGVNGVTLVQGSWSDTITTTGGAGNMSLVAHASGVTIASTSGRWPGSWRRSTSTCPPTSRSSTPPPTSWRRR